MRDQTADHRPDRMQPVRERRRDAEVPAAAAKRPEEVGMGVCVDREHVAGRGHELDRQQIVRSEAVLRHQPAEAAAEGVARDARRRDSAAGDGQAVCARCVVELGPDHALGRGGHSLGIDRDLLHLREVDHHAAVRHGTTRDVVAAAPDRDVEPFPARDGERRSDVARRAAADDQRRPAVDEPVVDRAGAVVPLGFDRLRGAGHDELGVGEKEGGLDLERKLGRLLGRIDRAVALGFANCCLEPREPPDEESDETIPHRAWLHVDLRERGRHEAAARKRLAFHVAQVSVHQPA